MGDVDTVASLDLLVEWTNFAFYSIKIRLATTEIAKRGGGQEEDSAHCRDISHISYLVTNGRTDGQTIVLIINTLAKFRHTCVQVFVLCVRVEQIEPVEPG